MLMSRLFSKREPLPELGTTAGAVREHAVADRDAIAAEAAIGPSILGMRPTPARFLLRILIATRESAQSVENEIVVGPAAADQVVFARISASKPPRTDGVFHGVRVVKSRE